jgi:uncharacterized protein (TIGR02145 family)
MRYCVVLFILLALLADQGFAQDTIQVYKGWNIIGSLYDGAVTDGLGSSPCAIITSPVYQYRPGIGYQQVDTMKKGEGYWVKVGRNGLIIFGVPYGGPTCPPDTCEIGTVEYGGKIYTTVQIGNQCWLKENLDIGVMIQATDTAKNNGTIEKYCYGDNPVNCSTDGGLYLWNEAMQYSTTPGVQGICPPGWHIPSHTEFLALSSTVGGDGNALKAVDQGAGAGAGTNTSGFSALLAGYRYAAGNFTGRIGHSVFWSSTQGTYSTTAVDLHLYYENSTIEFSPLANTLGGFSMRCIMD